MLSEQSVQEVVDRLAGGESLRRTARLTGVSISSVCRILKGRREIRIVTEKLSEPIRCEECGASIVVVPCLACELRKRQERQKNHDCD